MLSRVKREYLVSMPCVSYAAYVTIMGKHSLSDLVAHKVVHYSLILNHVSCSLSGRLLFCTAPFQKLYISVQLHRPAAVLQKVMINEAFSLPSPMMLPMLALQVCLHVPR